jgi:hypothetical protein
VPPSSTAACGLITTYKQKFGFPLAAAPAAFETARACRHLRLRPCTRTSARRF